MSNTEKLKLDDGKNLNLHNVVQRKLMSGAVANAEKHLQAMTDYIKNKGLKTKGPFIIQTEHDGTVLTGNIFMQLSEECEIKLESPYVFIGEMRIEDCLRVQYRGDIHKMQYATLKGEIHAFENDIELSSRVFVVYIDTDNVDASIDVFLEKIDG